MNDDMSNTIISKLSNNFQSYNKDEFNSKTDKYSYIYNDTPINKHFSLYNNYDNTIFTPPELNKLNKRTLNNLIADKLDKRNDDINIINNFNNIITKKK